MEPFNLKDVLDLGTSAVLLFLLWQLWAEYRKTNDRLFTYLEEARKDRMKLAQAMDVSLQSDPHMKRPPLD